MGHHSVKDCMGSGTLPKTIICELTETVPDQIEKHLLQTWAHLGMTEVK